MIRLPALLIAATLLVACGGDGVVGVEASTAGPFDMLPTCGDAPGKAIELDVELTLPDATVVLERTEQAPLTFLTAYVELTPPEVRAWYEAADGVELLISEDEIFEVELLFSNRVDRAYLKGTATCRTGTTMTIVVAAEVEGAPDFVPGDAFDAGRG